MHGLMLFEQFVSYRTIIAHYQAGGRTPSIPTMSQIMAVVSIEIVIITCFQSNAAP
jgi:hypothetical protein